VPRDQKMTRFNNETECIYMFMVTRFYIVQNSNHLISSRKPCQSLSDVSKRRQQLQQCERDVT
jgi:hypothetical protein